MRAKEKELKKKMEKKIMFIEMIRPKNIQKVKELTVSEHDIS